MLKRLIGALALLGVCATTAFAQIPDLRDVAKRTFDSRPAEIVLLRQICDQTDALRSQFGEDDPRVQEGEVRANNLKGMFTRRIAYAVNQIDPRFGLRFKQSGAHAVRPTDGVSLATDVLLWRDGGQVIDVMSDRNPSWGMTPGDVQPSNQWIQPLPELDDAPVPAPQPLPPPTPAPAPQPTPSAGVDYSPLLQQILNSQQLQIVIIQEMQKTIQNTNEHVVSMDRTLTQTLGSISKFVGEFIAPSVATWWITHHLSKPAVAGQ